MKVEENLRNTLDWRSMLVTYILSDEIIAGSACRETTTIYKLEFGIDGLLARSFDA